MTGLSKADAATESSVDNHHHSIHILLPLCRRRVLRVGWWPATLFKLHSLILLTSKTSAWHLHYMETDIKFDEMECIIESLNCAFHFIKLYISFQLTWHVLYLYQRSSSFNISSISSFSFYYFATLITIKHINSIVKKITLTLYWTEVSTGYTWPSRSNLHF